MGGSFSCVRRAPGVGDINIEKLMWADDADAGVPEKMRAWGVGPVECAEWTSLRRLPADSQMLVSAHEERGGTNAAGASDPKTPTSLLELKKLLPDKPLPIKPLPIKTLSAKPLPPASLICAPAREAVLAKRVVNYLKISDEKELARVRADLVCFHFNQVDVLNCKESSLQLLPNDIDSLRLTVKGRLTLTGIEYLQLLRLTTLSINAKNCRHSGSLTRDAITALPRLCALVTLQAPGIGLTHLEARLVARWPSIRVLVLDSNGLGDKGAVALGPSASLRSLSLANNGIGPAGAYALSRNHSLTELNLNGNPVGDDGISQICSHRSLRTLGLADTKLGARGLLALAGMKGATSFDLSHNRFESSVEDTVLSIKKALLRQTEKPRRHSDVGPSTASERGAPVRHRRVLELRGVPAELDQLFGAPSRTQDAAMTLITMVASNRFVFLDVRACGISELDKSRLRILSHEFNAKRPAPLSLML